MLLRQTDSARSPCDRQTSDIPRQFILAGTTNDSQYLQEPTGNRRYWPVKVGSIDIEALERDRNQIWAEAAHYESLGEGLELPSNLWRAAGEAQGQRSMSDPIEERIETLVGNKTGVIPNDDLYAIMGLGAERIAQRNKYHHQLLRNTMERLGWTKDRRRFA